MAWNVVKISRNEYYSAWYLTNCPSSQIWRGIILWRRWGANRDTGAVIENILNPLVIPDFGAYQATSDKLGRARVEGVKGPLGVGFRFTVDHPARTLGKRWHEPGKYYFLVLFITKLYWDQPPGAVEYTNWISTEELDPPHSTSVLD